MKLFFKIFLITFIIAGAVLVLRNPIIQDEVTTNFQHYSGSVKGINTKQSENITTYLQEQAMNIKIMDVITFFDRTQKVAHDFKAMQDYVKEQTKNFKIASKSAERK